jgi:protein-S-isoprenylcysteine O-methyltransferase Ste14
MKPEYATPIANFVRRDDHPQGGAVDAILLIARGSVLATGLALAVAGLAVLAREHTLRRPPRLELHIGPLALVNYVAIGLYVILGPAIAIWGGSSGAEGPVRDAVRLSGIALLSLATFVEAWAIRVMGRNLVSEAEVRADTELVTGGPFGLVRHPLFSSLLLLWAGAAACLLSPVLAVGLAILLPAFYLRARIEEDMLIRHFGEAYLEYAACVPMFVPRLRRTTRAPCSDRAGIAS